MSWFTHDFEAPLERHGVGRDRKLWYTVVFLPPALSADLPFDRHPQLRIDGEVADVPVSGAFIPSGDGRHYLIVSPETRKQAGIELGQTVTVRFRVADQTAVDVPEALADALAGDAEAAAAWDRLTVGRRRALAHHVASAKTAATRDRRIAAVIVAVTGRPATGRIAVDAQRLGYVLGKG